MPTYPRGAIMKLNRLEEFVGKDLWLYQPFIISGNPNIIKLKIKRIDYKSKIIETDGRFVVFEAGPARRGWLVMKWFNALQEDGFFFRSYLYAHAFHCRQRVKYGMGKLPG